MKKVLLFGVVALFTAGTFMVTSCKDDNPVTCAQKLTEVEAAVIAFNTEQTAENCNAYKNALQDYIDCDGVIADKTTYQTTLDGLDCSVY